MLLGPQLANGYVGACKGALALRIGEEELPVYRTGDRVRLVAGRLVYLGTGATTNSR